MKVSVVLFVASIICFVLAALDVKVDIELVPVGLALFAAGHIA